MIRRLLVATVCAMSVSVAGAQQAPVGPAPAGSRATAAIPKIPHTKFVLGNGLTLLVHEDHKAPIVAVNVWYHVGSKNEKPGKTGFAHLFEHLMFNGSENFNDDYFKAVEPLGATDLNGTTNEDRTNYFQNVPVSALDRLLWLESDRMGHLLGAIDKARLDEQRGVVQNEKRQGENQPYGKSFITVAENTYPKGHPYSWSVIGSMEDLNAASLDDVKEWFRTYYGAANAVLVIAGDVTPDDVRARVEKYFGDIPSGPPVIKHQEWIAKGTGTHRQVMQDRVPQARVIKVWNTPGLANMETVALEMAQDILATGKTSRLYKRLVYKDRTATGITGFTDQREIGGQIWVWADAQPGGDVPKVEAAVDEELARFLRDGPTPSEVQEARVRMRANYVRGIERIGGFGGKSDILAQGQVYGNDPDLIPKKLERAQRTTAADILAAARRWMSDGQYVLEVRPFPEYTTATTAADRSKMPPAGDVPNVGFPTTEKTTLANGLKVQLVRRTAVPVVNFSLLLDAGYAADKSAAPGTAKMTLAMLDEGTTTRTSQQISDELAALGARLGSFSDLDASHVTLSALTDNLGPSLAIYSDVLLNPSFPQTELDRLKQNTLAEIQQEKVEPIAMALRVLPQLVYGSGHAYAMPLTGSGTESSVKAMTREGLQRFHRTWFTPGSATILVVGNTTMAELKPQLERAFAAWKSGEAPRKEIAEVLARKTTEVYLLDRPGAEQSVILSAQLVPPTNYPRQLPLLMFNDAFGGAFSSRMNMNLREDKHWSYGAGAFSIDARGQRLWFVYAPVQTDKTKESLQEVVKETREVATTRPISAKELQEAKDRQIHALPGRWETSDAVLGALRDIVDYSLPEDFYATFGGRAAAVSDRDVQSTIADVLRPDAQVFVVVGDLAKIEAGVRELKLGPVHLLDADGRVKESTAK